MKDVTSQIDWMDRIGAGVAVTRLAALIASGGLVAARGLVGSSATVLGAAHRQP